MNYQFLCPTTHFPTYHFALSCIKSVLYYFQCGLESLVDTSETDSWIVPKILGKLEYSYIFYYLPILVWILIRDAGVFGVADLQLRGFYFSENSFVNHWYYSVCEALDEFIVWIPDCGLSIFKWQNFSASIASLYRVRNMVASVACSALMLINEWFSH